MFRSRIAASVATLAAALLLSACATTTPGSERSTALQASPEPQQAIQTLPPRADRDAILSMAGEHIVTFAFDETVALEAGYERKAPKRSGASELVIVVEDEPDRIVLQHLLLVGGPEGSRVIKHWRQDWTFEADQRLEFVSDQTWRLVDIDPELTEGAWTQCVYEVSDAPRYCGTGRWNHRYGNATWTSDRTWRPLPRREYTTRDDYTALNVENRHTITPEGWTHEQDNSKVLRIDGETESVLVREFGFNNYIRTDETDFSAAYEYWNETDDYWARVRSTWRDHIESGGVILTTDVDGMPIIDGLFALADRTRDDQPPEQSDIDAVFNDYVVPIGRGERVATN